MSDLIRALRDNGYDLSHMSGVDVFPSWLLKRLADETGLDLALLKRLNAGLPCEIPIPHTNNSESSMMEFNYSEELDSILDDTLIDLEDLLPETDKEDSVDDRYLDSPPNLDVPVNFTNDTNVKILLNDLRNIKRLNNRGQREAKQKYVEGDFAAFQELLITGLPWVLRIAAKETTYADEFLDLFQEGIFGLAKAIEQWDPTQETPLGAFCGWQIVNSIRRFKASAGTPIRLPVNAFEKKEKIIKAIVNENDPADESLEEFELARLLPPLSLNSDLKQKLKLSIEEQLLNLQEVPLHDNMLFFEDLPDDTDIEEMVIEKVYLESVREWLNSLNLEERERYIIEERYGFNGQEKTLEQIGEKLGVTRERVRQIEKRVLKRIRHPKNSRLIRVTDRSVKETEHKRYKSNKLQKAVRTSTKLQSEYNN